jgi:GNAT superfamily N-acetyltransferase
MQRGPARCIDLLHVQDEALFDDRGRIAGCFGVTIASSTDGQALWIGADVPDPLARELTAAFDRSSPASMPSAPPPALERCAQLLASAEAAVHPRAGPSYRIPAGIQFACDAPIVCSAAADAERLRGANPGNWLPVEWDELLDGRLGPWAIVVHEGQAVSICHTPRPMTERAAECGVWTAPTFRGRGYAAATAAAWAPLVRSDARYLFYSTDSDNRASQRVAARLGLDEIGWMWRLHRPPPLPPVDAHPLSSLHASARA